MTEEFDFEKPAGDAPIPHKLHISILDVKNETEEQRKRRMLLQMQPLVQSCSFCLLGRQPCLEHDSKFDPHVFSTMNVSPWLICGQNPGFNECLEHEPFVGEAGRFFNERIEKGGLSRSKFYISNACKCLRYNSRVKLANNKFKPISHLVRERYKGRVKCVVDGKIVNRKVIGWHKSSIGNRKIFKLFFKNSPRALRRDARGVTLTGDHQILTRDGYQAVNDVFNKRIEISTGTPAPGIITEQIINGSLLGDSGIFSNRFQTSHCIRQKALIQCLARVFKPFGVKCFEGSAADGTGKYHKFIRLDVCAHPYFRKLRRKWYPRGKKIIPRDIKLTDVTLAMWYMDDGSIKNYRPMSPKAEFAMNDFSEDDVDFIISEFQKINIVAKKRNSHGWRLILNTENSRKFYDRIAKYIIPSMRYKLPQWHKDVRFLDVFKSEPLFSFFDQACVVRRKCPDKSAYCIDVEEAHNFITSGGVVHNCHTLNNEPPTPEQIEMCSIFLKMEILILEPILVITLGAAPFSIFCPNLNYAVSLGKIQESKRFNCQVFPIYHPSPRNMTNLDRLVKFKKDVKTLCRLVKAYELREG